MTENDLNSYYVSQLWMTTICMLSTNAQLLIGWARFRNIQFFYTFYCRNIALTRPINGWEYHRVELAIGSKVWWDHWRIECCSLEYSHDIKSMELIVCVSSYPSLDWGNPAYRLVRDHSLHNNLHNIWYLAHKAVLLKLFQVVAH